MVENSSVPADAVPVAIDPVCGNCVHWRKNEAGGDIGHGLCFALPPSVVPRGQALIKVRSQMAANEHGCTALFTPRPEVVELAVAQQRAPANAG